MWKHRFREEKTLAPGYTASLDALNEVSKSRGPRIVSHLLRSGMLFWSTLCQAGMGMRKKGEIIPSYFLFQTISWTKGLMVRVLGGKVGSHRKYSSPKGTRLGPGWRPSLPVRAPPVYSPDLGLWGVRGPPFRPAGSEPFFPALLSSLHSGFFLILIRISKLTENSLCKGQ